MNIKKIIGSTIVAVSIIGSSSVFAQTDSGSRLEDWYGKEYHKKAEVFGVMTTEGLISPLIQFNQSLVLVKERISEKLSSYRTDTIGATAAIIQGHHDQQVDQLHITSNELKEQHIQAIKGYTEQKKQQEAEQIEKEVVEIVSDLTQ